MAGVRSGGGIMKIRVVLLTLALGASLPAQDGLPAGEADLLDFAWKRDEEGRSAGPAAYGASGISPGSSRSRGSPGAPSTASVNSPRGSSERKRSAASVRVVRRTSS